MPFSHEAAEVISNSIKHENWNLKHLSLEGEEMSQETYNLLEESKEKYQPNLCIDYIR
jgi:hypothetical protein